MSRAVMWPQGSSGFFIPKGQQQQSALAAVVAQHSSSNVTKSKKKWSVIAWSCMRSKAPGIRLFSMEYSSAAALHINTEPRPCHSPQENKLNSTCFLATMYLLTVILFLTNAVQQSTSRSQDIEYECTYKHVDVVDLDQAVLSNFNLENLGHWWLESQRHRG